MTSRRPLAVGVVLGLIALSGGCTSGGDERPDRPEVPERRSSAASPSEPTPKAPNPTNVFSEVTSSTAIPAAEFEISLDGAVKGKASGSVRTRCLEGPGFFDVEVTPDAPMPAGDVSITSVVFGAPGFRGPGSYDAARADDAEWSVGLVDVENGAPFEFYSPMDGPSGSITVHDDGKSGRFEIRGLVDDEGGTLSATGRFTCSVIER